MMSYRHILAKQAIYALLACTLASAYCASLSAPVDVELINWVVRNGGMSQIQVHMIRAGYKGAVASKNIQLGEVIAAVPVTLSYDLPPPEGYHFTESDRRNLTMINLQYQRGAVQLLKDIADSSSSYQPFFKSLPSKKEAPLGFFYFAPEYLHLLQNKYLAESVLVSKNLLDAVWKDRQQELRKLGFTYEDLQYSFTMLTTRAFKRDYASGMQLIPLLDMANHVNVCPHYLDFDGPCPGDIETMCVYWVAGADIEKGEEVCNSYGGMWNDKALLQYGFLQESDPPQLLGIDRYDLGPEIWQSNNEFRLKYPPDFKADSVDAYLEEVDLLRGVLHTLQQGDAYAAKQQPVASDPEGKLLRLVLRLRELRKRGVKAEIKRIKQLLQRQLQQLQEALATWRDEEEEELGQQWQCDAGGQGAACRNSMEGVAWLSQHVVNAAAAAAAGTAGIDPVHST